MEMNEPGRTIALMGAAAELMRDAEDGLDRYIPEHCREGLRFYIARGRPVGDFLRAVLSNSFTDVLAHADDTNLFCLHGYMLFLYNDAPPDCWGSKEAYGAWCKQGGLAGLCKEKVA